ncbi:hypothetical protein FB45DRAFT_1065276 [Roridomyces roridus]|uniref:DOMON domain-containing protein n=1 Tax=Roridomyces roridus TaxID=1738132 RepID=A0AAD7FE26_9AGAR|nr:hypothetical protein FB45DRAFT_1065276 [Roridomyces roridus]
MLLRDRYLLVSVFFVASVQLVHAQCSPSISLSRPSNRDTAVLLPMNNSRTWTVSQRFEDSTEHPLNVSIPDANFWLTWMDSDNSNTDGGITAQSYQVQDFNNSTCLKSYIQPFNFTSSSTEFVIGEPTRIWWAEGTTQGNVTVRVSTLGARDDDKQTQDMDTIIVPASNITLVDGQGEGFDWYPSISPRASFILTLGDERGLASGGSLFGVTTSTQYLCAYQMNGTYAFLQRMLMYALLLFGTVGLFTASNWMTGPFLGAAMAYAGATAIHAIILAFSSREADQRGTIDLDSLPIFQILSVCLYLCAPLLMGSYGLRRRTGNMPSTVLIVCAWGTLIAIGFFCSIVIHPTAVPPCAPTNITFSDGSIRSISPNTGDCASLCPQKTSILRMAGEAQMESSTITVSHVFGGLRSFGWFIGPCCTLFILLSIPLAAKVPLAESSSDIFGEAGRMLLAPFRSKSDSGERGVALLVICLTAVGCPDWSLAQERVAAVGQWGPWVTVAIASGAAVLLVLMSSTRYGEEKREPANQDVYWPTTQL